MLDLKVYNVNNSNINAKGVNPSRAKEVSLPPKFSNESSEEVQAYLTPKEKEVRRQKLNQLPNQDKIIDEIVQALDQNHLQSPIFQHSDFYYYSLLALERGKISGLAFTTAQLFHNTLSQHPASDVEIVPLFQGDSANNTAVSMVDQTSELLSGVRFKTQELRNIALKNATGNTNTSFVPTHLTPAQRVTFFEMMKSLPDMEKQYLIVPDPHPPVVNERNDLDRNGFINERLSVLGFNVFMHVSKNGQPCRVIPSKGMMQAYLIAKAGHDATTMVTREGLAPFDDMLEMIPKLERPFAIDSPDNPIKSADGHIVIRKLNEGAIHDFYHANIMSSITGFECRKFYALAHIIKREIIYTSSNSKESIPKKNSPSSSMEKTFEPATLFFTDSILDMTQKQAMEDLQDAFGLIVDMEHTSYQASKWNNLPTSILEWAVLHGKSRSKTIARVLAKELVKNGDHYRAVFGIGTDNLSQLMDYFKVNKLDYFTTAFESELKEAVFGVSDSILSLPPLSDKDKQTQRDLLQAFINNKKKDPEITLSDLISKIRHGSSYLIRDRATEEFKLRLNLSDPINCKYLEDAWLIAEERGAYQALYCVRDFIVSHYSEFIAAQDKFSPAFFSKVTSDLRENNL